MKEINHEYYVSLEVANLLKEAGFDWGLCCDFVYAIFSNRTELLSDVYVINEYESNLRPGLGPIDRDSYACKYYAPTLDVAQRWLREVKSFDVLVLFQWLGDRSIAYKYELRLFGRPYALPEIIFDSYEDAQEAGIKKALEIILEKGE